MPSGVQQFDRDAQSSTATAQFFGSAFTAGNSVYVLAQLNDTTSTATVSDDGGNTYALLQGPATVGTTRFWLWRAASVAGTRPSLTLNPGGAFAQFAGWEVSGDDPTTPIDTGITANTANDASPSSGAITVAHANDLVLATLWTPGFGRAATLDSSFTHIEGTQGPWGSVGYKTETGTAFTETGSVSGAIPWYFVVVPIASATPPQSGGAIVRNLMIG